MRQKFKLFAILLCFVQVKSDLKNEEECQKNTKDNMVSYENCETTLMDDSYSNLQIMCHTNRSYQQNSEKETRQILMTATFRTTIKISRTSPNASSIKCIKLTEINMKFFSLNDTDTGNARQENKSFESEYTLGVNSSSVGFIRYNESCVSHSTSKNNHLLVTQCVIDVTAVDVNSQPEKIVPETTYIELVLSFTNLKVWKELNVSLHTFSMRLSLFNYTNLGLSALTEFGIGELNLGRTNIARITNDFFPPMPSLTTLRLNDANLTAIEDRAFDSLPNLLRLNLAGNQLDELPSAATRLTHLVFLNVSSNRPEFRFLVNSAFLALNGLINLDMSNLKIIYAKDFLLRLEQLETLNMSNVDVRKRDWEYAGKFNVSLPRLKTLMLAKSRHSVRNILGHNFTQLRVLDVSKNRLENKIYDYKDLFRRFPNLRWLNVDKNNIKRVVDFLPPLNRNYFVSLRDNNIESWNKTRLYSSKNANLTLDLSNNKISKVSPQMLADFSSVERVILENNPFDCNQCAVLPFVKWLTNHQPNASYQCFTPEKAFNKSVVDLSIDSEACLEKRFNWLLFIIVPLSALSIISLIISAVVIKFKWQLRYFYYLFRARIASRKCELSANPQHHFDAFVSYCSVDSNFVVEHLVPRTEQEEPVVHLCIHDRDFLAGGVIINNIIECIDASRKSIFLISKSFIRSNWCQWELQMAQHKLFEDGSDVLILILLENVDSEEIPKTLKRLMATRTYLVWPDPNNAPAVKLFWSRLKQAIGPCHCKHSYRNNEQSV